VGLQVPHKQVIPTQVLFLNPKLACLKTISKEGIDITTEKAYFSLNFCQDIDLNKCFRKLPMEKYKLVQQ
jgi:hypothetical protein